jgi:hypothetical protein
MPKNILDEMKIHFVENMDDVLEIALIKELPAKLKRSKIDASPEIPKDKENGGSPPEPSLTN